jgi:hypothetical protein
MQQAPSRLAAAATGSRAEALRSAADAVRRQAEREMGPDALGGEDDRAAYGSRHQKLRKAWARQVAAGGRELRSLGQYQGPEHRACSRATASRRLTRHSRVW